MKIQVQIRWRSEASDPLRPLWSLTVSNAKRVIRFKSWVLNPPILNEDGGDDGDDDGADDDADDDNINGDETMHVLGPLERGT